MKDCLHSADSRGLADHGWLISRHSFSFADYYNPQRMNFGLLRVINDDIVKPSMGFATHPHKDMEIISVPLSGELRHEDSMGNRHIIRAGEVQVMSAGSGITHSEYNHSDREDVNFLQIWIQPKEQGIPPGYGQRMFSTADQLNTFQLLVAPGNVAETIWINQDAYLSMAHLETGKTIEYTRQETENGLYLFIIEGQVTINELQLSKRDAVGLTEVDRIQVTALSTAQVLCIDVPMHNQQR